MGWGPNEKQPFKNTKKIQRLNIEARKIENYKCPFQISIHALGH